MKTMFETLNSNNPNDPKVSGNISSSEMRHDILDTQTRKEKWCKRDLKRTKKKPDRITASRVRKAPKKYKQQHSNPINKW